MADEGAELGAEAMGRSWGKKRRGWGTEHAEKTTHDRPLEANHPREYAASTRTGVLYGFKSKISVKPARKPLRNPISGRMKLQNASLPVHDPWCGGPTAGIESDDALV